MTVPPAARLQHAILRIRRAARLAPAEIALFHPSCRIGWSDAMPHMYRSIFVDRDYAPLTSLPARPRILDLGGFVGLAAIYFLHRYPNCSLICVEPNPHAFALLERAVTAFAGKSRPGAEVTLLDQAVGIEDGKVLLNVDDDQPVNVAANIGTRFGVAGHASRLPVETIDVRRLLGERIDFVKMDIEGAEYSVLSCPDITPDRVPEMVVELHDIDRHGAELARLCADLLDKRGYRAVGRSGLGLSARDIIGLSGSHVVRFIAR